MATIYDEWGNPIGDDEMMDDGMGGGYGYDMSTLYNSPYMQAGMPGQNFGTAKHNLNQPLAVGQNVYNQILTGLKNLNQLPTNQSVLYNAQVATGEPTMNMNALQGLDASGMPYGGGGAGGGGGGNGYNPNFTPTLLNQLSKSAPGSEGEVIYNGITKGNQSPLDLKLYFRKKGGYDSEQLKAIDQQVDDAFNEFSLADRNQVAGANQPAVATPIQEWMNKNGLINPMDQYTAENLPGDVDLSAYNLGDQTGVADTLGQFNSTARHIKAINDEREGLSNKARVNNLGIDLRSQAMAALARQGGDPSSGTQRSYNQATRKWTDVPVPSSTGHGITAFYYNDPTKRMDTGSSQGALGAVGRFVNDAAAGQLNPGGDVARMAMLKRSAAAQERRKAGLVASAQAAPAYDQAVRQLAAKQVQNTGRTPARDAQRAVLRYLQQGGLPA